MTTPDNLLTLAAELARLSGDFTSFGAKLATAAAELEQEAANLAEDRSRQWGFDIQVAVGVKGGPAHTNTSVVEVRK